MACANRITRAHFRQIVELAAPGIKCFAHLIAYSVHNLAPGVGRVAGERLYCVVSVRRGGRVCLRLFVAIGSTPFHCFGGSESTASSCCRD